MGGKLFFDLLNRDPVVSDDLNIETTIDLAQSLHQVVGERIIIIDEKNHWDEMERIRGSA